MERSYGFLSNFASKQFTEKYNHTQRILAKSKGMQKSPKFHTTYDPIVTKSKGMQKSPDFHASYVPMVTKSKGMLKLPEFHKSYDPNIIF